MGTSVGGTVKSLGLTWDKSAFWPGFLIKKPPSRNCIVLHALGFHKRGSGQALFHSAIVQESTCPALNSVECFKEIAEVAAC